MQSSLSSAGGTSSPPLRKPHPVCTITAIRAVAPTVVVIRNRPNMPFGNHAEGAGCGLRFDYRILEAARWLLGSGLGDVFVGTSGEQLYLQLLFWGLSVHPRVQCGSLRIQLCCHEQRNVRFGWDPGQVSDCNYGFVSKQGHPRTVGMIMPHLCGPSNPAASMVLVHSGTPNSPV